MQRNTKTMRIGLIAGSGQFPIIFSKKARSKGFSVYAAAHHHETDPTLEAYVDAIKWIHLGQIKRLLQFFKENNVSEAVMLGAINKTRMFSDVKPDMKTISLIVKMRHTHDDGILRAFAGVLADEGIQVKPSTFLLPGLLAQKGCWTKRRPAKAERADMELGWKLAKEIGRLDIGQCVVVGGGSVLAVEAIDGTDATIRRGGQLGNGTAVLIKVSKPNQDLRFDMPAVGVETIQTMNSAGVTALALEACKAVVFDRQEMVELADACGIAIVAME
ncbi:MAG: UDP-2,3-diacylglucosamine diphosphatase LpxI [Desulfobacterales bacterium]|nr:UDP-2,3-diacylglucosamine diphosphatase LpxI [Desulfobacterales bacterium]